MPHYRWHFFVWPDNGGYHAERKLNLYHARRSCFAPNAYPLEGILLVEAPGTAPGAETIIPYSVYRYSRLPDKN